MPAEQPQRVAYLPIDHLPRWKQRLVEAKRRKTARQIERLTGQPPVVVSLDEAREIFLARLRGEAA